MDLDVRRLAGALGASLTGVDLTKIHNTEQLDGLREALAQYLVVFLPDQKMNLDDLERVTDLLGGRDATPFVTPLEDRPFVIRVVKEPTDQLNFANAWHSDLTYLPEPPSYTLLHAAEVPPFGGDTIWSNQYLAYESLSRGLEGDHHCGSGSSLGRHGVRNGWIPGPGEGSHVHGHRSLI